MKPFAALAALALTLVGVVACDPATPRAGYALAWADEFNDPAFTMAHWRLGSNPQQPGPDGAIAVADGNLTLTIGDVTDHMWTNVSTMGPRRMSPEPNYYNPTTFTHGYFEARVRFTSNEWVWPAFWLFSAAKEERWPDACQAGDPLTSEIDWLDAGPRNGIGPNTPGHYFGAIHRNTIAGLEPWCGQPDTYQVTDRDLDIDLTGWHIWGGKWTDDEAIVYLDGTEVARWSTYDSTDQPMAVMLSLAYGDCSACAEPRPSELQLTADYVRVYQQP